MRRRERSGTIIIEREGSSAVWWLLVGGLAGAGLALLFAPQSGDRTRRAVGRRLGKLKDAADEVFEDLRDALSPEERVPSSLADSRDEEEEAPAGSATSHLEDADGAEHRPETARRRTGSARQELEQRLTEARARRQRALAEEDEEPVA